MEAKEIRLKHLAMLTKHGIDIDKKSCRVHFPDQWYDLIDKLIEDLIALGWDRDLHQIKSKFGSMRFYIGESSEEMQTLIHKVEASAPNDYYV